MYCLMYRANTLANAKERNVWSRSIPYSLAYIMIGTDSVIPWLPLPQLIMTGIEQPSMRASDPAAA